MARGNSGSTPGPLDLFCARLKRLQLAAGVTQTSLAGTANLSTTQMSDILNGKIRELPAWDVTIAVVRACLKHAESKRSPVPPDLRDAGDWRRRYADVEHDLAVIRSSHRRVGPTRRPLAGMTDQPGTRPAAISGSPEAAVLRWPLGADPDGTPPATTGLSVPLELATRDPGPVFTNVLKYGFEGRKKLINQILTLVDREPCGFAWIEAEAGLGKTAIAAYLAREHGWISHFARYMRDGRSVRGGLQNLAAQLVARYGLDDMAPAGMLLGRAFTPEGFESLLGRAAQCARSDGHKLVLVVDGADEAESLDGKLPWALPGTLPDGVFVIGTYRTGHPPARGETTRVVFRIEAGGQDNRADVGAFLQAVIGSPELSRRLSEAHVPASVFISQLAERCGGVWIYLRYVLDEVRLGLRDPDDLADLPRDLTSFYISELARWRKTADWSAGLQRLLAVLAVAREPIRAPLLSLMSGSAPDRVQHWCDYLLRPFLSATTDNQRRFELYHGSLRDCLTGDLSEHDVADEHQVWARVLRQSATWARRQVVEYYLQLFGGLDNGLPKLAKGTGVEPDGGYALRNLVSHMAEAGRANDLHRLLALECAPESGRRANLWFSAHDQADTLDDYLHDLSLAQKEREAATNRAVERAERAPALSEEVHYALLSASITSLTDNLVPELMARMLATDLWSPQKAFTSARRITSPLGRAAALTAIAPHLPTDLKTQALAYVLAATPAIADDGYRAKRLTDVARLLPAEHVATALDIAVSIKYERCRAEALAGLSSCLTGRQLSRALTVASKIDDVDARADALAALGPHLSPGQLSRAVEVAAAIWQELPRAEALVALAPHLDSGQLERALQVAIAMPLGKADYRARALTGIAPYLPAERRPDVVTDALETVRHIPADHGWTRAKALFSLAPQLKAEQLAHAMDVAAEIPHKDARAQAMAMLGPYLDAGQLERALHAALEAKSLRDLARLLPNLPPEKRSSVLSQMLKDARSLVADYVDHGVLPILAPQLRSDQLTQLLDAACASSQRQSGRPLVILAPHLRHDQLDRALRAASVIEDAAGRAATLSGLAPHLTHQQLNQALAAVSSIPDNGEQLRAITGLAPYLTAEQLPHAAAITSVITDDDATAIALAELAGYVPDSERKEVLAQAETATRAVTDPADRAHALTRIATLVEPGMRAALVEEAWTAGMDAREHERANALIELMPLLDQGQLATACAVTAQIAVSADRVRVMACLSRWLPAYLEEQFAFATTTTDDYRRSEALSDIAALLNPLQLTQALEAIAAISGAYPRGEALVAVAPYLPASQFHRAALLAGGLDDIHRNSYHEATVLAMIAPRLPMEQQPAVLAQALDEAGRVHDYEYRGLALGRLVAQLTGSQRQSVLADALEAVRSSSVSEQDLILTTMAPGLTYAELDQILDMAIAIDDRYTRSEALVGLGSHLSSEQLARALDTVSDLGDEDICAMTLAGLAPHLPLDQLARAIDAVPAGRGEGLWNLRTKSQRKSKALAALMTRADELTGPGNAELYLGLLRAALRISSRDISLRLIATCAPALNRLAGSTATAEIVASIPTIRRWWPGPEPEFG